MSLQQGSLIRDEALKVTKSLPAGNATTVTTGIDLGHSANGQPPRLELLMEVPALTEAELGNSATLKLEVYHDTAVAFGTEGSLYGTPNLTVTGSGGAAAASKRVALPTNVGRYVRVKATTASNPGNAATSDLTVTLIPQ